MRAALARSQERILAGLERLGEKGLSEMVGNRSKCRHIAFRQFLEAYHAGQTGGLRRFVGKAAAIP